MSQPPPPESQDRLVVLHHHVFKNAGTTLDGALEREFGPRFATYDGPRPNHCLNRDEIAAFLARRPAIQALSSHQARPRSLPETGFRWLPILLVRHPLDRVRSIYAFERRQRGSSPGARMAKQLDLPGYVRWRMTQGQPNLLCDYHLGFLSVHREHGPKRPDLDAAKAALEGMALTGTVERFDESVAVGEAVLRRWLPGLDLSCAPRNVTQGRRASLEERLDELREALGDTLYDELVARNQHDLELHRFANALLDRRLEESLDASALEDFRRRCAARSGAEVT